MIAQTGLRAWIAVSGYWAAATPSPAPKAPNANLVTPGVWGFLITFLLAVVTVLLIIDMTRRIRRTRYRAEIAEKLDAEAAEAAEVAATAKKSADGHEDRSAQVVRRSERDE